jgi:hypothetical protein
LNVESKHGTVVKPIVNENQTVPDWRTEYWCLVKSTVILLNGSSYVGMTNTPRGGDAAIRAL